MFWRWLPIHVGRRYLAALVVGLAVVAQVHATRAFDQVVHHSLVYAAAVANGFTPDEAAIVANGSYSLDDNDATTAFSSSLLREELRSPNAFNLPHMRSAQVFHALSSPQNRRLVQAAHIERIRGAMAEAGNQRGTPAYNRALLYLGQYLHFVGDTFVHPNDPLLGHFLNGHRPDRADLNPRIVSLALSSFSRELGDFRNGRISGRPVPQSLAAATALAAPQTLSSDAKTDRVLRDVARAVNDSWAKTYAPEQVSFRRFEFHGWVHGSGLGVYWDTLERERIARAASEVGRALQAHGHDYRAYHRYQIDSDGEPLAVCPKSTSVECDAELSQRMFGKPGIDGPLPFATRLANRPELLEDRKNAVLSFLAGNRYGGLAIRVIAQQARRVSDVARDLSTDLTPIGRQIRALDDVIDAVALRPTDAAAVQKARHATQSAREYLRLAQSASDRVQREFAAARSAKSQADASAAFARVEQAHREQVRHLERAREIAAAAQRQPPTGITPPERPALARLRQMADELAKLPHSQEAILLRHYEGAALPPRPPGAATTPSGRPIEAVGYDPATRTLRLQSRQRVDVGPLVDAVRNTAPRRTEPLFKPVPRARGHELMFRLDPAVQRMLASRTGQAELRRVGGVALDVTFTALDLAGATDFVGRPGRSVIEQPVLLSLRALLEQLEPHARDAGRWEKLPPALRQPASMARLHGFVVVPERDDIVLVGAAGKATDALDIDSLILLLRAAWRDGLVPGVSLDAIPGNVAGPQYARVINLPADSTPARVMLDADYAMKAVLFGSVAIADPAYRSLAKIFASQPPSGPVAGRFWLVPTPLAAGAVAVADDGRIALFDAAVEARAEDLTVATMQPLGHVSPQRQQAAAEFTRVVESLKSDPAIAAGLYQRLQGLVDVVTIGTLLRRQGVRSAVLDRFVALPYRVLRGPEAAPSSYPGITTTIDTRGGPMRLSGGVEMAPRPRRRSMATFEDTLIEALRAKSAEPFNGVFERRLAHMVSFPALQADAAGRDAESHVLLARRALTQGDAAAARSAFEEALKLAPDWSEAWVGRARADALAGNLNAASEAIAKARLLDLSDPEIDLADLEIALARNPALDLSTIDAGLRRDLSRGYVEQAFLAITMGQLPAAKRWADRALDIFAGNHDAYIARTLALADSRSDEARRDATEAITILRRARARSPADLDLGRKLAMAMALDADLRIGALSPLGILVAEPLAADDGTRAIDESLRQAATQAADAQKLDGQLGFARFVELYARVIRIGVLKKTREPFRTDALRIDIADAIKRFASMTAPFTYLDAHLDGLDDKLESMVGKIDRTVATDSSFVEAVAARAVILARQSRCADALRDLERLRALSASAADGITRYLRGCTR